MCDLRATKTQFCEDTEATFALEVQVAPDEFSESLQEYITSKEQRRKEYHENMRAELNSVNSTSDKELEDIIEVLKEEIKLLDKEMHKCLEKEINGSEQWRVVQDEIKRKEQRVETLLYEFSLDLTDLEKTRCENIKIVLGKHKKEAVKEKLSSLESIEEIFEDIIANLNSDTLLHNLRHYEDLKLRFRLEGDAIIAKHRLPLRGKANGLANDRANELWGKVKKEQVKDLVAETIDCLVEKQSETKGDLDLAINDLLNSLSDLANVLEITDSRDKNEEFWENLVKTLELNFETVHVGYLNLDELLKSNIAAFIESFDNERSALVHRIKEKFYDKKADDFSLELATLENIKQEELVELQAWRRVLKELSKTLYKAQSCSLDIIKFWHSNNIVRLKKVRLNLEASFESSRQRCVKKEQELNSKIKTQTKALREASDKTKLETLSKVLKEIFTSLEQTWNASFEQNVKSIEEVKNEDIPLIVKQTISNANLLLEKYPNDLWISESCFADLDLGLKQKDQNSLVFKFVDYIALIEKDTYSIYKDLEKYVSNCEYEINEEYESMLSDVSKDINKQYAAVKSELASKTQSFEDIKNVRLAELDIHSERLRSHQAGVNVVLNEVTQPFEDIKSNQILKLKEFQDRLENFHETRQVETWNQINIAISELEQEWNTLSIALENRILDAKMVCQHKFETLKHSNDSFQKIAKNFKNGGNYSQDEIKTLTKELKQLEKLFSSQRKILSDRYTTLMKDISRQEVDRVVKILEDKLKIVSLNDQTEETLRLTRMKLRSEICQILTLESTFDSKVQSVNSLGKLDNNLLDDIVLLGRSILNDMACTVPLECEQKPRESSTPQIFSKKDVEAKRKKSLEKSVTHECLFENVTVEELNKEINFMSRVKLILSEKYLASIQNIENTLRPQLVEVKKSKKKEPIDNAETAAVTEECELIRRVLHSYNKECESIWFYVATQFIRQLNFLQRITEDLTEKTLNEIHFAYLEGLAIAEKEHKCSTSKILTEGIAELNHLRKSIVLPLAHPSYQCKLEELYQHAKSVSGSKIKVYKELVCNYKVDLQKKHDVYVRDVTILKEMLENCQTIVFDTISYHELTEKIQDLEICPLDSSPETEKDATELMLNQPTDVENEGAEEGDKLTIEEIIEIVSPKYPMSVWTDDETNNPEHISQFIDIKPVEKNSIITLATFKLKDSVERIQNLYKDAETQSKYFEIEIAKCMMNFKHDKNQAKHIYTKICK